jgi:hypothetical protein
MKPASPKHRLYMRVSLPLILVLACAIWLPSQSAASNQSDIASTAKTLSITESISAHLVSHLGANKLTERGRGSGSLSCPVTIAINISYTHANVTFECNANSGLISGKGETTFYASGGHAYFHGYLTVIHGTGRYAHSVGSRLYITGTARRNDYEVSATVTGSLSL